MLKKIWKFLVWLNYAPLPNSVSYFLKLVTLGLLTFIFLFLVYSLSFGWCANWAEPFTYTLEEIEYLDVNLAFEGSKQMPYYLLSFHVFLLEFFGADPTKLKFWNFALYAPIYVVVVVSPIAYGFAYLITSDLFPKDKSDE